jgi:hypothetical protein
MMESAWPYHTHYLGDIPIHVHSHSSKIEHPHREWALVKEVGGRTHMTMHGLSFREETPMDMLEREVG